MEVNNNAKRQRISSMEKPEAKRCEFYLIKKKRNCKLYAREGKKYCPEHGHLEPTDGTQTNPEHDGNRIPCPLDPKHTVFKHKLEKHLKVCNAVPTYPSYYVKGINLFPPCSTVEVRKLKDLSEAELSQLLQKVSAVFDKTFLELHHQIGLQYDDFQVSTDTVENENKPVKHAERHQMQVQSLCGILDSMALIVPETAYVEMGSGTGEFTCGLIDYMKKHGASVNTAQYVLVDRESHRHKQDTKLKYETDLQVFRARIDIKDLALDRVPSIKTSKNIVAHSKHLCGEATDLALAALFNETVVSKTIGLVVATCCHHRCQWDTFVGKDFLLTSGFSEQEFGPLTGISSWAICGSGKAKLSAENENEIGNNPIYNNLFLTHGRRKVYGYKVKKLLDYARVSYIRSQGLDAGLKTYATENVTGETGVLVARRNRKLPTLFAAETV